MKTFRLFSVSLAALLFWDLSSLYAASITHSLNNESDGRVLLQFGESALFDWSRTNSGFTVSIQKDSVQSLEAEINNHAEKSACQPKYERERGIFSLVCARGTILKTARSYTISEPRRFVVEYTSRPGVQQVAQGKMSTAQKAKKREPAVADMPAPIELSTTVVRGRSGVLKRKDQPEENSAQIAKEEVFKGRELKSDEIFNFRNRVHLSYDVLRQPITFDYELPEFPVINRSDRMTDLYNLAIKMYRDGKYGLTLQTIQFIRKIDMNHPVWQHLLFLEAETYVHIAGHLDAGKYFQEAISRYKTALSQFPDSIYTEPVLTHVGKMQLERGEFMGAMETFIGAVDQHPTSRFKWQWKWGIAEALYGQTRYEEAFKGFRELSSQIEDEKVRLQGLYRMGDVFMARKRFKEAIAIYREALDIELGRARTVAVEEFNPENDERLPASIAGFPSVIFNLAEAYFWTDNLKSSLTAYRRFVKEFPLHDQRALGYARIGEILEVFDAPQKLSRGAYLESLFRHPDSLGADISQMRMAVSDLAYGSEDERRRAEIVFKLFYEKYKKDSELLDFYILLRAEVLYRQKNYLECYSYLEKEYLLHPQRPLQKYFKNQIFRNISLTFREMRRNDECAAQLGIYHDKKNVWFTRENPFFDYSIEVALCALKSNLPDVTLEMLGKYEDALSTVKSKYKNWESLAKVETVVGPAEIEFYQSIALLRLDKKQEAMKGFKNVISSKEATASLADEARMYLALTQLALGQPEVALSTLEQIKDRSALKNFPVEIISEVTRLKRLEHFDVSLKILDELLRHYTTPAEQMPLWIAKAEILWINNKRIEARKIYQSIADLSSEQLAFDPWKKKNKKNEPLDAKPEDVLQRSENLKQALNSRIVNPDEISALQAMSAFRIGLSLVDEGKLELSRQYFERAQKISPDSTWATSARSELNSIQFRERYEESIQKQVGRKPATKGGKR